MYPFKDLEENDKELDKTIKELSQRKADEILFELGIKQNCENYDSLRYILQLDIKHGIENTLNI